MSYNEYGFTSPEEVTSSQINGDDLKASFSEKDKKDYPKSLSNNPLIAKVQGEIYNLCGIDVNTENNLGTKRLAKGFLDGSIFSKAELINMIGNLNPEEVQKVALYILSNIGSILAEIAMSIPNGLKGLLSKNTYDAGISLAELIPTNKFVSIACAPVGIALKKAVPAVNTIASGISIRGLKSIAEREAHLAEILKKPVANAEQIRRDIQSGAINHNYGDIESRMTSLYEMTTKEREQYLREAAAKIGTITNQDERQKAIEAFEPWKKLTMKFSLLDGQKYNAPSGTHKAIESTVETGIRREL